MVVGRDAVGAENLQHAGLVGDGPGEQASREHASCGKELYFVPFPANALRCPEMSRVVPCVVVRSRLSMQGGAEVRAQYRHNRQESCDEFPRLGTFSGRVNVFGAKIGRSHWSGVGLQEFASLQFAAVAMIAVPSLRARPGSYSFSLLYIVLSRTNKTRSTLPKC
jgi:hypothetical protein